jgi:ParB family chromosome partitioning protein
MTTQRIGTPRTLPPGELTPFHKNPRRGNVPAIAESLATNGQFRPIVVNAGTHTGRPNEVLAGNHTLLAALMLEEEGRGLDGGLDCYVVDVTDREAERIVLADNRTADLGSYDDDGLLDLLESLGDDLSGTGYADDDVQMLRDIADAAPSLDDLADEYGEPEEQDTWITVRLRVPPVVADQWQDWANPFDSDEEAFEALLDRVGVE